MLPLKHASHIPSESAGLRRKRRKVDAAAVSIAGQLLCRGDNTGISALFLLFFQDCCATPVVIQERRVINRSPKSGKPSIQVCLSHSEDTNSRRCVGTTTWTQSRSTLLPSNRGLRRISTRRTSPCESPPKYDRSDDHIVFKAAGDSNRCCVGSSEARVTLWCAMSIDLMLALKFDFSKEPALCF